MTKTDAALDARLEKFWNEFDSDGRLRAIATTLDDAWLAKQPIKKLEYVSNTPNTSPIDLTTTPRTSPTIARIRELRKKLTDGLDFTAWVNVGCNAGNYHKVNVTHKREDSNPLKSFASYKGKEVALEIVLMP